MNDSGRYYKCVPQIDDVPSNGVASLLAIMLCAVLLCGVS